MTDTPSGSAGSTFRLIYRSRNRIPEHARKAELGAIYSVSRSGNKQKAVTGALLIHGDWFVQALEGDEDTVRALYEHIAKDGRHERVSVISTEQVDDRVFGRWAMARVSEGGEPDIPLLMNVTKGGISRAAERPTTVEQEQVLYVMRDAVRNAPAV